MKRAWTMRPSASEAATRAQRRAPAVCDEEGPTMTGPSTSKADVVARVCGLAAMGLSFGWLAYGAIVIQKGSVPF